MSVSAQSTPGNFHIVLKLRGPEEKIKIFHALLRKADSDYPWDKTFGTRMCTRCNGLSWSTPRINPEDLKTAARQTGVRLKIRRFSPERSCVSGTETIHNIPMCYIPNDLTHRLYAAEGIAEVRSKLRLDAPTVSPKGKVIPLGPVRPAVSALGDVRCSHGKLLSEKCYTCTPLVTRCPHGLLQGGAITCLDCTHPDDPGPKAREISVSDAELVQEVLDGDTTSVDDEKVPHGHLM
jgi:hypothetical protein